MTIARLAAILPLSAAMFASPLPARAAVARLDEEDMLALAAYLAAQAP